MSNDVKECRSCKAPIVWMKTRSGKSCPVNADTYHGEELFDRGIHTAHFATCPNADQFRKPAGDNAPTDAKLDEAVKEALAVWVSTLQVEIPGPEFVKLRVGITNAVRKALQ